MNGLYREATHIIILKGAVRENGTVYAGGGEHGEGFKLRVHSPVSQGPPPAAGPQSPPHPVSSQMLVVSWV